MRRRALLRAGATAGLGALGLGGTAGRGSAEEGFRPIGRLDLEGATEAVVGDDGTTAFVALGNGYATIDLSEPTSPSLLAERRDPLADRTDGQFREIQDVKVDGDRLLVVGPAHSTSNAVSGALLVDVSDPAAPSQIAFHETDYPIHNCFLHGGHAYLTATGEPGNPLAILDAREGREVARWSLLDHDGAWSEVPDPVRQIHDVWVQDGIAYLAYWDAGTWLLDVSDPASPTYVADVGGLPRSELAALDYSAASRESTTPPGNAHYVTVDDDAALLGVGRETWAVDPGEDEPLVGGPSGVDLYDISDPTAPDHLSTIEPPPSPAPTFDGVWTTSHNFEIVGGTLYTSWYQGGVKRHDVTDPAEPVETSWWRRPDRTRFWTAQLGVGGEFFVASSMGIDDVPAGVYVFPDAAGTQPTVPEPALTPQPTGTPTPGRTSETTTGTTPRTTTAPTATGEEGPGFGVLGTLAALGIGTWRRIRRRG